MSKERAQGLVDQVVEIGREHRGEASRADDDIGKVQVTPPGSHAFDLLLDVLLPPGRDAIAEFEQLRILRIVFEPRILCPVRLQPFLRSDLAASVVGDALLEQILAPLGNHFRRERNAGALGSARTQE